jgi:hypothetical protein
MRGASSHVRAVRTARLPLILALAIGGSGCLSALSGDDDELPPECESVVDCNAAAGEICAEGLCYGDPPTGAYAAVIGPPDRDDLIATEVPVLAIAADGSIDGLVIQPPVTLSGEVRMACTVDLPGCSGPLPVLATISVARPARFAGGNDFRIGAESIRVADASSFSIAVPALAPEDDPYVVTVMPSPRSSVDTGDLDPASLVPPVRLEVRPEVGVDAPLDITLGDDGPRLVVGKILDGAGRGIAGARIAGYGRWAADLALERVSTITTSRDDGSFRLLVAGRALDALDLVVQPPASMTAPILRVREVATANSYQDVGSLRLPSFPVPTEFRFPIVGFDPSGAAVPVVGATVTLAAVISDGLGGEKQVATFTASATTDEDGIATVQLIPGTQVGRTYALRINPPAASPFASIYERALVVGAGSGSAEQVRLPQRVPITGRVIDEHGAPVEGVAVVAKPALRFTWTLDDDAQSLLEGVQPPTQVTASDGSFVVFVDPDVAGVPAQYDLDCEPAPGARVPRWTATDVPADSEREIQLPAAAHVRGEVRDGQGKGVADAEVRVYAVPTALESCVAGPYRAGGECEVPANLVALGRSDGAGWVRLVLPRP